MLANRGIIIHPHELDEHWLDKLSSMGLNVLGLHPAGGELSHNHIRQMIASLPSLRPLLDRAREMGMTIEYEMHALSHLLPRELFETHPEWFRMNEDGQRTPDVNLCASNEEGLAFLGQQAAELAKLLPASNHMYYFWLDDVASFRCHCEHCRKLSASDQQLKVMNAIQRGIRTVDELACVPYLAYQATLVPPSRVQPDEGVFLEYAPFRRKVTHAIYDPSCPENAAELQGLKDLIAFFGLKNAKVLDYWTDNSLFSGWKYPPKPFTLNADVMRKDVAFYRELGFASITAFGCYLGRDYIELHGDPDLRAYGEILCSE